MSTDDLMTRVRDHLAHADTLPHGLAVALVSELADEVDRLRAENDECAMQWRDAHDMFGAVRDERDAARAALERVRALTAGWRVAQAANRAALARGEWTPRDIPLPDDYDRALEGES